MTDTLNIKNFIVTGNNISQCHDLFGKLSAPSIAETLLLWRVFLTNWFTVKIQKQTNRECGIEENKHREFFKGNDKLCTQCRA